MKNSEKVELVLPGIDKIWIRSDSGKWVEKTEESEITGDQQTIFEEEEDRPRRRWMFWKR